MKAAYEGSTTARTSPLDGSIHLFTADRFSVMSV